MTALMITLLSTTETFAGSSLLAGTAVVGLFLCLTVTSREEKAWREMDARTQVDIGLSPYAPAWLAIRA